MRSFGDDGSVREGLLLKESSLEADCFMNQRNFIDLKGASIEVTYVDWADGLSVIL